MQEEVSKEEAREAVKTLLKFIGENPEREGLLETPDRILRSFDELYGGYKLKAAPILKTFRDGAEATDEMIVQRNIPFFSMCEHHMLPFVGVAHVGYLPNKRIVGLSKMARLVEVFGRRLQVQERMTAQISQAMMDVLEPRGAACVIEATHLCMAPAGHRQTPQRYHHVFIEGMFQRRKNQGGIPKLHHHRHPPSFGIKIDQPKCPKPTAMKGMAKVPNILWGAGFQAR